MSESNVNLSEAQRFLDLLGLGEEFTFQTFHDAGKGEETKRHLARILHGTLETCKEELLSLHDQGAGVFVMPNRGDGKGRTGANVVHVRANFVDLDGAPIEPIMESGAPPSIVVQSSPGKFHVYWRVTDEPLEHFTPMQEALIKRFGADPSVKDLARVLRVPGFLHRKKEPFLVLIIYPARTGENA